MARGAHESVCMHVQLVFCAMLLLYICLAVYCFQRFTYGRTDVHTFLSMVFMHTLLQELVLLTFIALTLGY